MSVEMHPYYLSDFINRLISQLKSDTEFLTQGLHSTYKLSSKRDTTNLQWNMVAVKNASDILQQKLKELEQEINKVHDKKV
jgi:hypothetical protein